MIKLAVINNVNRMSNHVFLGKTSAYTGVSAFGKVNYLKMADGAGGEDYIGGSKTTAKALRAGWLNQASDFAHSSKESFKKRSFVERALMFSVSFAASHIGEVKQESIDKLKLQGKTLYGSAASGIRQAAAGYFEYDMQQKVHFQFSGDSSDLPWQYKYRGIKLSAVGYKALFYGLKLK